MASPAWATSAYDIFYADYNHYSHDYSLPLFIDAGLRRALDAYLESDSMMGAEEMGIIFDSASKVGFDECVEGESCEAWTGYLAHEVNRSHRFLDIPRVGVKTTDGVKHAEKVRNVAASMPSGAEPITLRTFEQEDLRGGVELYHRPKFAVAGDGLHGIFSYGSCDGTADELMPEAFIMDGSLEFDMFYQGDFYSVSGRGVQRRPRCSAPSARPTRFATPRSSSAVRARRSATRMRTWTTSRSCGAPVAREYQDVDHNTGEPALWPLGVDYDAEALVLR